MFGLCSHHIPRGFYAFLLVLGSGCLHSPFFEVLLRWRKNKRGRLLRIRLAWAHGTLCAQQMVRGREEGEGGRKYWTIKYFSFNFPTIVWILLCQMALGLCLGHLCQSERLVLARHGHILKKEPFPGKLGAKLLRNPPLIVRARPPHLDHLGKFGPEFQYLFHTFYHFISLKIFSFLWDMHLLIFFLHIEQSFCIFRSFKKKCTP